MLKISIYWGLTTIPGFIYHILPVFPLMYGFTGIEAWHQLWGEPDAMIDACVHLRTTDDLHMQLSNSGTRFYKNK